jgi:hypothetical protein
MSDKTYVLLSVDADGNERRQYDNGQIRNQNGALLELPDALKEHAITSDTARTFHAMRKAKILRAIEARLQDVTKTNIPADAIAAIVAKRAAIAMSDDTRTGNEAAKIVLSAVDAYQDKAQETTHVQRHEYTIDDETRQLLEAMVTRRRGAILDGNIVETE